jgi:hypothetical protein
VLAVGMNLFSVEVMDEETVSRLEAIIIKHLARWIRGGLEEEQIIFNFSVDPSVITPQIPVAFRISLLPSSKATLTEYEQNRIAKKMKNDFLSVLKDRPNILVMIECLEGSQVGMSTFE